MATDLHNINVKRSLMGVIKKNDKDKNKFILDLLTAALISNKALQRENTNMSGS